ncbi:MAG TPA: hydrogenase maturation nickel metallochaperone HypA [Rhodospirillales bacterium]|nr:hydrogenase maturation nickel metallochaperone HypA [Rhodospirillales bacterium]
MHEFSICRSLLRQIEGLAAEHNARSVTSLKVAVGPLSGVEPGLLERAFSLARCGSRAEAASIIIETPPISVHCRTCGRDSPAAPNRLICGHCGDFRVDLASGDELILVSVEMECNMEGMEEDEAVGRGLASSTTRT